MRAIFIFVALIAVGASAQAAETTTYMYDALGRLDVVAVSGGPATGVSSDFTYDPAGNRTATSVTGASASANLPQALPTAAPIREAKGRIKRGFSPAKTKTVAHGE